MGTPLRERFLESIDVDEKTGCWNWIRSRDRDGYGIVSIPTGRRGGRKVGAHRVAYELFVGPIPEGLSIDHLCRNRCCVNPEHLEAVTIGENIRRGTVGQARGAQQSAKTHCRAGHPYDEKNTYWRQGKWRDCRICRVERRRRFRARQKAA